jgi:hypothetical protein
MNPALDHARFVHPPALPRRCNTGIGSVALASLLAKDAPAKVPDDAAGMAMGPQDPGRPLAVRQPMFRPGPSG